MIADVLRKLLVALLVALLLAVAFAAGIVLWLLSGDGIRQALEQQASARLGVPVQIGSANAQFYPRIGVRLGDVRIGTPVRATLASVSVSTGLRALLSRRIENAALVIADSRLELPLPLPRASAAPVTTPAPSTGESTGDSSAPGSAGLSIVSVRDISLQNVTFVSRGRDVVVSAQSSLAGDVLTLSSLTLTAAGTTASASGAITLRPEIDADVTASADRLNLDDLLAVAGAFAPAGNTQGGGTTDSFTGRVTARISAASATAGTLPMTNLTTVLRVSGPRLSLSPTRFVIFGGRYDGDLDIDLRDDTEVRINSRFTALDVAQLAAYGGAAGSITGRLTATATITGRGRDLAPILASARGTGNVTISDGTIANLDLVRTVIVFFGRPSPASPAATDAFSRIDARLTLAGGIVTAEAFSLTSPDADMAGRGTLSLATRALDGTLDLSLSEALSKEAGTDLARFTREGNRIVLPARLGGTLGNPRISIDTESAIRRGLRNELERRMQDLLDRFRRP
jgi:uncharacterized protein involved in outer membrane biogenesis